MKGHRGKLLAGEEVLFDRVHAVVEPDQSGAGHRVIIKVPWRRVQALRRADTIVIADGPACALELEQIESDAVRNETVGTFICRSDPLETVDG